MKKLLAAYTLLACTWLITVDGIMSYSLGITSPLAFSIAGYYMWPLSGFIKRMLKEN